MAERVYGAMLASIARLPQGAISRLTGRLADLRLPRALRAPLLGGFARIAGIDTGEAEHPPEHYGSLNEFFVRRLRSGLRSWPVDADAIASPADGVIGACGRIDQHTLVQAKGLSYSSAELLQDAALAERFDGGAFVTIYLSPRHYHRVHAPAHGAVAWAKHVPGRLLPVNPPALVRFPHLFARNERVVCVLEQARAAVAIVAVGAINVGRISVAFDPAWIGADSPAGSDHRAGSSHARHYDPPKPIRRGEEIMAFHLGSTVILLISPGAQPLRDDLESGREIRLGAQLTRSRNPAES